MTSREQVNTDPARQVRDARSFLFGPGDRPERFDKAVATSADVVILDLEDAVTPDRRADAHEAVGAWVPGLGRAAVRVSAVGTEDHDLDVAALTEGGGAVRVDGGMVAPR